MKHGARQNKREAAFETQKIVSFETRVLNFLMGHKFVRKEKGSGGLLMTVEYAHSVLQYGKRVISECK